MFFFVLLPDFAKYLLQRLPEGIIPAIILAIYLSGSQWRNLNKIRDGKIPPTKIDIAEMILNFSVLIGYSYEPYENGSALLSNLLRINFLMEASCAI